MFKKSFVFKVVIKKCNVDKIKRGTIWIETERIFFEAFTWNLKLFILGSTFDPSRDFGESAVDVRQGRDGRQVARGGDPIDGGKGKISGQSTILKTK